MNGITSFKVHRLGDDSGFYLTSLCRGETKTIYSNGKLVIFETVEEAKEEIAKRTGTDYHVDKQFIKEKYNGSNMEKARI